MFLPLSAPSPLSADMARTKPAELAARAAEADKVKHARKVAQVEQRIAAQAAAKAAQLEAEALVAEAEQAQEKPGVSKELTKPFQWHLKLPDDQSKQRWVNFGGQANSHQQERLIVTVASQACRLMAHGKLAEGNPGYELDEVFVEEAVDETYVIGSPCLHVESGEFAAYLGPSADGMHKVCILQGERTVRCPFRKILPLPSLPATPGEWVLYVDPHPSQFHLCGRIGVCMEDCEVRNPQEMGVAEHEEKLFMVCFPSQFPEDDEPDLHALPQKKLVRLPMSQRDEVSPWEEIMSDMYFPAILSKKNKTPLPLEEAEEASDEDEENQETDMQTEDELGTGPKATMSAPEMEDVVHGASVVTWQM